MDPLMNDSPQWTSDLLLSETGMPVYSEQVRMIFREYREDFRRLGIEVYADLKHDPVPGDNKLQATLHAWQVAHLLRQMEAHAQKIVALARELERTYKRVYIELPQVRERKAIDKALQKSARAQVAEQSAATLNSTVRDMLPTARSDEGTPVQAPVAPPAFDLFKEAQ